MFTGSLNTDSKLRADIGLLGLFTLGFGTIIGIGWVTMLGPILTAGGSFGATAAFAIGALAVIVIGLSYAELGSMYPVAGAEVVYAYRLCGVAGAFLAGWLIIAGFVAAFAFSAISAGWLLSFLVPTLAKGNFYTILGHSVFYRELSAGLAIGIALTWINFRGGAAAVRLQVPATIGFIAIAVVLVIGGLTTGNPSNLSPHFALGHSQLESVTAVLVITPFFYAGFSTVSQALAERRDTTRRVAPGIMLLATIGCAGFFYCSIILAAAYSADRALILSHPLPAAGAFEAALGSVNWAKVVICAGILGVIISWNALIFGSARVVLTLARGGLFPEWTSRVHPTHKSPANAVLTIGTAGLLLTCLGPGGIDPIANLGGLIFSMLFLITCTAMAVLRIRDPKAPRPFKVPAGLAVALFGIVLSIIMISLAAKEAFQTRLHRGEWLILATWAIIAVLSWTLGVRRRNSFSQAEREQLLCPKDSL
jgi:APA family basic amino acid/polyamine antiporter